MPKFKLGLIINPFAGIGGEVALKGSDGAQVREQALAMGAQKKANAKTQLALTGLLGSLDNIEVLTASGEMGEELARAMGFETHVVYSPRSVQTEAIDTQRLAEALLSHSVDVILFAGGDGTARDVCHVVGEKLPVIGVPAGCKIHSGVYAVTPSAAGKVIEKLSNGELVSINESEVKDIDETLFRQGKVQARHFGDMLVVGDLQYIQAVKSGGKESEELVLLDIAAHVIEDIESNPDYLYVMGSGSTVAVVMSELGLDNTLLGVDLVQNGKLLGTDLTASQLVDKIKNRKAKLVITLIGGQGHIFGRGNQQLSAPLIEQIGLENLIVVATKTKLEALDGRPLLVDFGDPQIDAKFSGLIKVTTGYRDQVLYPVANYEND